MFRSLRCNDAGTIPSARSLPTRVSARTTTLLNIPIGNVNFAAPNYSVNTNWIINLDYNQSDKTQHRGRFI